MSENHPLQGGKDFIKPEDKKNFENFKMEVDFEKDAERVSSEFLEKKQRLDDNIATVQKLSIEEREKIHLGLWQNKTIRQIAFELGRSPSTSQNSKLRRSICSTRRFWKERQLSQADFLLICCQKQVRISLLPQRHLPKF